MQQLGLSSTVPPKNTSRIRELLWPSIATLPGVNSALDVARWACFIIAGFTAVVALIGLVSASDLIQVFILIFALIEAFIFAVIGIGIGRKSRVFALLGLVFYLGENLIAFASGPIGLPIIPIIFAFLLANGVRAAFAYHQSFKLVEAKSAA